MYEQCVLVTVLECLLFTLAGVAVDTVPHHCGCWLWPCSEQCFQTVETNRRPLDVCQINAGMKTPPITMIGKQKRTVR